MKYFYGFRYFDRSNTIMGSSNLKTGEYSIAGNFRVFLTKKDLDMWLDLEKLTAPIAVGGGERIQVTKKEARILCAGETQSEFKDLIADSIFILSR